MLIVLDLFQLLTYIISLPSGSLALKPFRKKRQAPFTVTLMLLNDSQYQNLYIYGFGKNGKLKKN